MARDGGHLPLYSSGYGGPTRRPGHVSSKSGFGLSLQGCLVGVLLLSTLGMAFVMVSMHTELGHLRVTLGEREAKIVDLDVSSKRLQSQYDKRIETLEIDLSAKDAQVRDLVQKAASAEEGVDERQRNLDKLKADAKLAKVEMDELQERLRTGSSETQGLQAQLKQAQERVDSLADEKQLLKSKVEQEQQRVNDSERKLASALKLAEKYGGELDQAKVAATEAEERAQQMQKELEALKQHGAGVAGSMAQQQKQNQQEVPEPRIEKAAGKVQSDLADRKSVV